MGVVHWLDDRIDAFEARAGCNDPIRALGRRRLKAAQRQAAREGRSPEQRAWNPEMGPLVPVRGSEHPAIWIMGAASVVAYAIVFLFPSDESIFETLVLSAGFVMFMLLFSRADFSRDLEAATPVPPDAPVGAASPR